MSKQIHDESETSKITVRVPAELKEEYRAEVDSMSDDIRAYLKDVVDGRRRPESKQRPALPLPDSPALARTYETLHSLANGDGVVPGERAVRVLAAELDGYGREDARRPIEKLADRGYVVVDSGIPQADRWAVRVRPIYD